MIEITVVIPVFNDLKAIKLTIEALKNQSLAKELFEVIVIDNGSTDGSIEWLSAQSEIIFLQEHEHKGSPYSCRNRGIEVAKGKTIALLDSTCIPDHDWLKNGLAYLNDTKCQVFGGKVKFHYDNNKTVGKLFDSITHVQMEHCIKVRKEAKTANLWVNRSLFDNVGLFREGVRSGEDVRWTKHCVATGVELHYCETSKVYKFARGITDLLNKQYRIGKGQIIRWQSQGVLKGMMWESLKMFKPIKPKTMKMLMAKNEDFDYSWHLLLRLYLVTYTARLFTFLGNVVGVIKLK